MDHKGQFLPGFAEAGAKKGAWIQYGLSSRLRCQYHEECICEMITSRQMHRTTAKGLVCYCTKLYIVCNDPGREALAQRFMALKDESKERGAS